MPLLTIEIADEAAMLGLGKALASTAPLLRLVFLRGDLGVGKTTLCRSLIRAMGHSGSVKSPTFTLVEPYACASKNIYHFDLYRLNDPEELEFLGIRDYINDHSLCLIEWPERGDSILPKPDLDITMRISSKKRELSLQPYTANGEQACAHIYSNFGAPPYS